MNIEQIDYLLEVAKERSIRKAADNLHITPSAISQSILQIEINLGVTIFQRSNKGTTPTPAGKMVLKRAFELQCKYKELYDDVHRMENGHQSLPLKIAFTPTFGNVGYLALMSLKEEQKDLKVEIQEGMHEDIIAKILKNDGSFDLSLIVANRNLLENSSSIHIEPFYRSYVCIAVSKHSPLSTRKFLTKEDLVNESIAVLETSTHKELVKKSGLENNPVFVTSNNSALIRNVVKDGHAICALDDFSLINHQDYASGDIIVLPFKSPDYIYREIWAVYPKTVAKNGDMQSYLSIVKKLINQRSSLEVLV
ncbi:LysR family transcriptional regulator [Niallia circulans]|nr:LysR family transcriptional regulator [Niallia circulans]